jgi:hypothetical protein
VARPVWVRPAPTGGAVPAGSWTATGSTPVPATLKLSSASGLTTIAGGASVTLSGLGSVFTNLGGDLATIAGSFMLAGGQSFATPGSLTVSGSLTLGPGSNLSVNGSFTQTSTSTLTVQFSATAVGAITTSSSGTVTLAGKLALVATGIPSVGTVFTILDNQGTSAIGGIFQGLPEGSTITVKKGTTTMTFKISYVGGTGNDVTLTRTS